jgi:hypothetical protein
MDLALHFLHIYHLDFYLKNKSFLQNLRTFYGVTSFLPILILWHIVGLPTQFLLNFKTLTTIRDPHQKDFFFPFNCYNLAIRAATLTEIFSKNYWDNKVQDLMVESRKESFHFDIYPTYNEVHI